MYNCQFPDCRKQYFSLGSKLGLQLEEPDPRCTKRLGKLLDQLEKVLKSLTYREREVVKLRYGIGDGYEYNLVEIGRVFNLSAGRIQQIEAESLRKLRHPTRMRRLGSFLENRARLDMPRGMALLATKIAGNP